MNDVTAVAAVTCALRARLDRAANEAVPGAMVTVRPPDRARTQFGVCQLNLFLYQTTINVAWRNLAPANAETPLAIDLHYLVSVYGANDDDLEPSSHLLLAAAMRTLHDRPVLDAQELGIRGAVASDRRLRIAPKPLSLDETSRLWAMLQTPYRLSAAYEVSTVLIGGNTPMAEK